MPFKKYLADIGAALKQGNATEHTHRPALKTLLESLAPNLMATNEPKRIQCGAPNYIVSACGTGTFLHAVVACIREYFAGSPGHPPASPDQCGDSRVADAIT